MRISFPSKEELWTRDENVEQNFSFPQKDADLYKGMLLFVASSSRLHIFNAF